MDIKEIAKLIRYYIIMSTTSAGSGHVTSSLSAVELASVLFFKGFYKYDLQNPSNPNNDRVIFSKGHASPLFYSLYTVAGAIEEKELLNLRKITSNLEGHPTPEFKHSEVTTGSLGQGLSVGVGMALGSKLDKIDNRIYVLLGDSELAEGSNFEAMEIASYYKLNNLIGILDVNRLGQRGQTMLGHDLVTYQKRVEAFGWETVTIDGHDVKEIENTYLKAQKSTKPFMIIAKTIKGKGVSFLEDKNGWHGKALDEVQAQKAVKELGKIDKTIRLDLPIPTSSDKQTPIINKKLSAINYQPSTTIATRKAYGEGLASLGDKYPQIVALDGEVGNSTYAEIFAKKFPERFFEMFIAEQNMVGVATGLSKLGRKPFVSSFAAFLTRAHDQIRMAGYSNSNISFVGSHGGSSIGPDGSSQMGLEDIAMFRAMLGSVVLYPSDGNSTVKLLEEMVGHKGISYLRTTRADTPVIYTENEEFKIGGLKIVKQSDKDQVCIIGAGITLHEALKAHNNLLKEQISTKVVDLYSIKPIDKSALEKIAQKTDIIMVVEDHYAEGGIAEAVRSALENHPTKIISLAVTKTPHSGKPEEMLSLEGIDSKHIENAVKMVIR